MAYLSREDITRVLKNVILDTPVNIENVDELRTAYGILRGVITAIIDLGEEK